jgi:hypothetical protein
MKLFKHIKQYRRKTQFDSKAIREGGPYIHETKKPILSFTGSRIDPLSVF